MARIRILLVEDEDLHAETIKFHLENLEYTLAGHARDAAEGFRLFCATAPDMILMDINLEGEKDGVSLAQTIRQESDVPIIFITSLKDRETIDRAKETEPEAYLLKPIEETALEAAIEVALFRFSNDSVSNSESKEFEWNQDVMVKENLFVKVGKVLKKIPVNEVRSISTSSDKYCDVKTAAMSYSIRNSLSELEKRLPKDHFVRVHRAHVVNVNLITEVNEAEMWVKLEEDKLPIGRSHKQELMQRLNYLG